MTMKVRYSGGATNQFALTSLGGVMSNTDAPDNVFENIFDRVDRIEIINGRTDYRCFYFYNDGIDLFYRTFVKNFVVPENNEIEFAIEHSPTQVAQIITTEDITPVGLTFFKPTDYNAFRLGIGQIIANTKIIVWVKRKIVIGALGNLVLSFTLDGTTNSLSITQEFSTLKSGIDNIRYSNHVGPYLTDIDKVGEALTS